MRPAVSLCHGSFSKQLMKLTFFKSQLFATSFHVCSFIRASRFIIFLLLRIYVFTSSFTVTAAFF